MALLGTLEVLVSEPTIQVSAIDLLLVLASYDRVLRSAASRLSQDPVQLRVEPPDAPPLGLTLLGQNFCGHLVIRCLKDVLLKPLEENMEVHVVRDYASEVVNS